MQIQPIQSIVTDGQLAETAVDSKAPTATSFGATLASVLQEGNQTMLSADQTLNDFAEGKIDDLHSVVVATVQADLSFRFFLEMRNKLTESYQEISRMQF